MYDYIDLIMKCKTIKLFGKIVNLWDPGLGRVLRLRPSMKGRIDKADVIEI